MAHGVEDQVANGADGEQTTHDELNNNGNACAICIPWTWTLPGTTTKTCSASGPWKITSGPIWVGGTQCTETCWYSAPGTCICSRQRKKRNWNCTTCTWTQTGTYSGPLVTNNVEFFLDCQEPPSYVCPPSPNGTPTPTGPCTGWTPGPPCC